MSFRLYTPTGNDDLSPRVRSVVRFSADLEQVSDETLVSSAKELVERGELQRARSLLNRFAVRREKNANKWSRLDTIAQQIEDDILQIECGV